MVPVASESCAFLEEAEFMEVRTNRNRNKIRSDEQQELAMKSVGVVGMSVGRSVAMAMAMERVLAACIWPIPTH